MPIKPEPLTPELAAKIVDRKIGIKGDGRVLLLGDSMLGNFQDHGLGKGILDAKVFENIAIGGSKVGHWLYLLKENPNQFCNHDKLKSIDQLFICLGTNDLADPSYNPQDAANGIIEVMQLLAQLTCSDAKIRFIEIFPRYDIRPTTINDEIKAINNHVRLLLASESSGLTSVNIEMDRSYYDSDGLHFSSGGYKVLAKHLNHLLNK